MKIFSQTENFLTLGGRPSYIEYGGRPSYIEYGGTPSCKNVVYGVVVSLHTYYGATEPKVIVERNQFSASW